eukprot:TRINITY_DN85893_c0_g1_i1.p1 TRINITY_DN85893_c0_g1~~TRINITY_DN85893_c0_g1_i1.p1  ORF type:complete len:279 (-),score=71.05 TRINITY_DN85893_c0_g1_i1:26-862(-)
MASVFWILVLFFVLVLTCGIFVTEQVGLNADDWATGPEAEKGDVEKINENFATLSKSMLTLFRFVTLDDWYDTATLVAKQQPIMLWFFIVYIMISAFAMIALLTGVMTEQINNVSAASDRETFKLELQEKEDVLKELFEENSSARDGLVSADELIEMLEDKDTRHLLKKSEISLTEKDARGIFQVADVHDRGRISWREFKDGLELYQGVASAQELAVIHSNVKRIFLALEKREKMMEKREKALDARFERLEKLLLQGATGSGPAGFGLGQLFRRQNAY